MSDDEGAGSGRQPYNRPRRYPVAPTGSPAVPTPAAPGSAQVTRPNPSLAEAAREFEHRYRGAAEQPTAPRAPDPAPSRTQSTRGLLIGIAALVVIAVVGVAVGLSGRDDATPAGATSAGPAPTAATSAASSSIPSAVPGGAPPAAEVCAELARTPPFTSFVTRLRATGRMPGSYVEPTAGTRVAVCVGLFLPGGGAGRGSFAYLADYEHLPAARYAATLQQLGWVRDPDLPQPTFRRLTTTVTLVQQGSSLVTVVGTGR